MSALPYFKAMAESMKNVSQGGTRNEAFTFYGDVVDMTLAEQVVETLKQIGVPGMMISGEKPLRKLTTLYHMAQAEVKKEQEANG
jgi:hypothetical protein